MKFGVCIASDISDIDYVVAAEKLGYSDAWFADSQMIWSDCYATMALAAERTERIRIGTGVAISGTRPAPVTAAAIGTINVLAPGRTFLGVGAGNTAMRIMGAPPQKIADLDRYLSCLAPLLRGDETEWGKAGNEIPIRHIMRDQSFVNYTDPIPLHISGFGPRSLGLAGRHGDGAVLPMPQNPATMETLWSLIEAGAKDAGRHIDRGLYETTALAMVSVLDPGETADSDRIRHECGAFAMATVHYAYDQWRQLSQPPPQMLSEIWDDYCAMLDKVPSERLHQRIHAGHNCWVVPEEERFLSGSLIEATCMVGTRDRLLERIDGLSNAGLSQIMVLPALEPRHSALERISRDLIAPLSELQ